MSGGRQRTWADYYREVDEARTAIMYGDFARGRRDPKQTTVRVGTFAGGGRKLPPPTRETPWRRDHEHRIATGDAA
jgi:hypothetical protein